MKKIKYFLFSLVCIFSFIFVYAKNEITVESMTPLYDTDSGVLVTEENGIHKVVFNDKNQTVKYVLLLKNNTNDDISLDDISLTKSTEEFFDYELVLVNGEDVLPANSDTEAELVLKTLEVDGWGRNFDIQFYTEDDINVDNPNTYAKSIVLILLFTACVTGLVIVICKNNKLSKYITVGVMLISLVSLPSAKTLIELPIKLIVSFQSKNIMKANSCEYSEELYGVANCGDYWDYADKIVSVNIVNTNETINEYAYKFDVSQARNNSVVAYLVDSSVINGYYDLYLVADGILYFNEDSSYYFYNMENLITITNLEGVDTSNVKNMSNMFAYTGYNSENFKLDLSNFNTSKVTNMNKMFYFTGYMSEVFEIDVSSFNTSNVTDMNSMFTSIGINNKDFKLDLSNFDTSNVTDMAYMFANVAKNNSKFDLDLSNFNTSKVTSMSNMFADMALNATTINLNIDNFNTGNVTDMQSMFYDFGSNLEEVNLDVSHFNTSKVKDMSGMFSGVGSYSNKVVVNTSNFNTSEVENMQNMFSYLGYSADTVSIDISDFDTRKVIDFSYMFASTAYNDDNFTLDISHFGFDNAQGAIGMFSNTAVNSSNFDFKISLRNASYFKTDAMFYNFATKEGARIVIDYTYRSEDTVKDIMDTNKSNPNIIKGEFLGYFLEETEVGDRFKIEGKVYNVISETEDSYKLLLLNAVDAVSYDLNGGWEYSPGPKEINLITYAPNIQSKLNSVQSSLRTKLNDNTVTADLMTLNDFKKLGCDVPDDYGFTKELSCGTYEWLFSSKYYWTKSADSNNQNSVWLVKYFGLRSVSLEQTQEQYSSYKTVYFRPVITVSKKALFDYVNPQDE